MFTVKEEMILGPDGEINYSVTENHDSLVALNKDQKESSDSFSKCREMRQLARIPAREYHLWHRRYPGCWKDKNFLRSYMLENPEYTTVKVGTF